MCACARVLELLKVEKGIFEGVHFKVSPGILNLYDRVRFESLRMGERELAGGLFVQLMFVYRCVILIKRVIPAFSFDYRNLGRALDISEREHTGFFRLFAMRLC